MIKLRRVMIAALLAAGMSSARPVRAEDVTVFAAASLTEAFHDIASAWKAAGHDQLLLSFAASSSLARQLDQGAKAGIFVSADEQWMDWAEKHGLILPDTRHNVAGNELVLIMAKDRVQRVMIDASLNLATVLGEDGRLAVGDPSNVPAGIYAKEALESFGLWAMAEPRLARAENVRAALLLVARGEARAGVVYATDASASADVAVAAVFPPSSHRPIVYPAAVVRSGATATARALIEFLLGPEARAIFRARGFTVG